MSAFCPLAQAGPGMAPYLAAWPELFLLRAFTKTYGLPALRLGYGLGRRRWWSGCWPGAVLECLGPGPGGGACMLSVAPVAV